jgi:hypothetical protein
LCRTLWDPRIIHELKFKDGFVDLFKKLVTPDFDDVLTDNLLQMNIYVYLVFDLEWGKDNFNILFNNPIYYLKQIRQLVIYTFEENNILFNEKENSEKLKNLLNLVDKSLEYSLESLKMIETEFSNESNEKKQNKFQNAYGIIDQIITSIYFSVDKRLKEDNKNELRANEEGIGNYYTNITPTLKKIIDFISDTNRGIIFAPTAHRFMELLNIFLRYDVQGVLSMAHQIAKSSRPFGYNLDSLAVAEVVKLVETVLADYKFEIREGTPLEDLLGLLDIFAEAGWPEVLDLIWKLDEVFR